MFAYPCPFCTQRLLASPERIGQRTICPKCLKPIVIARPETAPPLSGELSVAELLESRTDPPSTIFANDDFHQPSDEADAMDLSLPGDFASEGFDSSPGFSPLPPLSDEELTPIGGSGAVATAAVPVLAKGTGAAISSVDSETTLGPLPLEYAGVVETPITMPTPAPQPSPLGGLGAGPAAFVPAPAPPTPAAVPIPQRASLNTPTPLPKDRDGVVVFQSNTAESADIAAELTTHLTMRMKPPPEPPSDLRLTTGIWLLLTATGFSLWLRSMMSPERGDNENYLLTAVKWIGAVEIVISYVWVAYLCGRRDTAKGLAALLPPVYLSHLINPPYLQGYRPLRFVIAGMVLLGLAFGGAAIRPYVHRVIPPDEEVPFTPPSILATPVSQLAAATKARNAKAILESLAELSSGKLTFAETPAETPQLIDMLKALARHDAADVRIAAVAAHKKWAGLEATKPLIVTVLRSKTSEDTERAAAFTMAREFKDLDVAKAVALHIGYRGFSNDSLLASDTLRAIGRPEAEAVLLELFTDEDLLIRGLPSLLADPKIGSLKSVEVLRALAAATSSKLVREQATATADRIESLRKADDPK
jgi:hypothetical protein